MKVTIINSATELLNELHEPSNYSMYRGHGNESWELLPSIARYSLDRIGYEEWTALQEHILENFQKYSLPYLQSKPENQHEWLIIAQHHGLPTNLLDWTTNPLKAAFFAVEDPSLDNTDGAIWAFEPTGYFTDLSRLFIMYGEKYLEKFLSYFPAHITPRVITQESCFTFFPLSDSNEPIQPLDNLEFYKEEIEDLVKFIIPKEKKGMCRYELAKLGVTHQSLFPGLDGIATSIRRQLESSW